MNPEDQLINQRKQKLKDLESLGINPYPYSFKKKNNSKELLEEHKSLKKEEESKKKVSIAGRIVNLRPMGKVLFGHIQDQDGRIQFYIRKDKVKNYDVVKKIDIGDYIGVEGNVFRTRLGEVTVNARNFCILSKSLRPLPEKWHGLKDTELRYRQRYLDLIVNPDVRNIFVQRSRIISLVREFLDSKGFLEVEIPTLQAIYGGGAAKPFKTHINAWDMNLFLSISPELYLKRLTVGGIERVYTICKNFRNEGVDRTHNPEFTMMESYQAYADYNDVMEFVEDLYVYVCKKLHGKTKIKYQGKVFDLKKPWKRLSVKDALKKYAKINIDKLSDKQVEALLKKHKIQYDKYIRGWAILWLFEILVEDKLIQPVFIIDYPKEASPLCKLKRGDDELIEKFEPYINGWEMGNGYSELTNPLLQREVLEEQAKRLRAGDEEAHPMDEDFVKSVEYGIPPTGGVGLGIDRMVMLLTDAPSLRDVILFPTMRPE